MRFWWVFILLSLFLFQLEANPEVRIRITQRGLNYAKEIGMKLLEQELKARIFPDEIGTEKYFFGTVDYTVSRIQIMSISVYNSSVILIPENGIRLLLKNISVTVTTHWTFNNWLIDYQGEVEISILGLSITTDMIVALNNIGDLLVSIQNCQVSTGKIEVQLNSEGRWFYNAFVQHLEKVIHTRLESQLCLNVILRIQKETEVLKGLKDIKDSGSGAVFISGVNITAILSSYFNLTTDALESIIPTITHIYAKPLPVIMNIRIIDAPVVSLHDNKCILEFSASMEVLAKMPNSTTESMFTLNITTRTHADLFIFNRKLLTTLCLSSFHISLVHSNVGLFEASLLDNFLSYILRTGIIPAANFKLKDEFPLSVLDPVILMKPSIRMYEGFLLISSDIQSLRKRGTSRSPSKH
ncbi:PREDICTED: BPI fold-containing family C protein [Thamnophis sirtalis]|uniref:Bactericidal permeability-increasing protein n=1 Tax=Thamnophis sirtalis TaxID=35019 RepID=A0A6I9X4H2_9SAUR|nr:PREDICTED: BPI fold-containing family C protein [Thamnophis sirtalis]